jgi:hypothetical protein
LRVRAVHDKFIVTFPKAAVRYTPFSAGGFTPGISSGGFSMQRTHLSLSPTLSPAIIVSLLIVILSITASATGPSEKTIYNFQWGNDGADPTGDLVADGAGNLYGTTGIGGGATACQNGGTQVQGCGTIFELSPPAAGHRTWSETVLYRFQGGTDGSYPNGGLTIDSAGNLYGIATGNSTICICDVIFKLSPQSDGTWLQSVLYTTDYPTDYEPIGALTLDSAGNLYGVTSATNNCGTVFQLSPPASGSGPWNENVLHQFLGKSDGCAPAGPLALDKFGNVYGTTGGASVNGNVFKLKPPATQGDPWGIVILHEFTGGNDGYEPLSSVVFHNGMNLYGTTFWGGTNKSGTVFELSPPAAGQTGWVKTTIFNFGESTTGGGPYRIVFDKAGNIYGATEYASSGSGGEIFKLSPPSAPGGPWTETTLYTTTCDCAATGVVFDKGNSLYGLFPWAGTASEGAAFAITP